MAGRLIGALQTVSPKRGISKRGEPKTGPIGTAAWAFPNSPGEPVNPPARRASPPEARLDRTLPLDYKPYLPDEPGGPLVEEDHRVLMPLRRPALARWLPERVCPYLAFLLILGAALLHLAYLAWNCPLDLAPDEAHYWDWSRHLDWSYYSKGPLVAWLIRGSCELFGGLSEQYTGSLMFAIRLPAVVCGSLLLVSLYLLTVQVFASSRLALAVVAVGADRSGDRGGVVADDDRCALHLLLGLGAGVRPPRRLRPIELGVGSHRRDGGAGRPGQVHHGGVRPVAGALPAHQPHASPVAVFIGFLEHGGRYHAVRPAHPHLERTTRLGHLLPRPAPGRAGERRDGPSSGNRPSLGRAAQLPWHAGSDPDGLLALRLAVRRGRPQSLARTRRRACAISGGCRPRCSWSFSASV